MRACCPRSKREVDEPFFASTPESLPHRTNTNHELSCHLLWKWQISAFPWGRQSESAGPWRSNPALSDCLLQRELPPGWWIEGPPKSLLKQGERIRNVPWSAPHFLCVEPGSVYTDQIQQAQALCAKYHLQFEGLPWSLVDNRWRIVIPLSWMINGHRNGILTNLT